MRNRFIFTCYLLLIGILSSCLNSGPKFSAKEEWGEVEIIFTPFAGEKPLYMDSLYESPDGKKYSVQKLCFFLSDIAFAQSTGVENKAAFDNNRTAVHLVNFTKPDFDASYGKQSCKVSLKMKEGEYSDIRFAIGVPRELNHSDPATASSPLNIGQAEEMYWEWNSGYIFFLAEGKLAEEENKLFHFAIGNDSRIMPFSFGNLFEVTPLIKVQKGKTTRVEFILDFNKLFINGDKSSYSLDSTQKIIVHGGYYADVLRNNLLHSIHFKSSRIIE